MTTPIPALPDSCWPIDPGCVANWDDLDPVVRDRASALAVSALRSLTGYRVGGCPITVRPCRSDCVGDAVVPFYGGYGTGFTPGLSVAGVWVNTICGCGRQGCSCTVVCEVVLPEPVGRIDSVQIDGQDLPPEWYRIDNGNKLVWQGPSDLGCWPLCQDMTMPNGEIGTFSVTYLNGVPVDGLGAYVAGVLTGEFAKACTGAKCRLPAGVVAITRQGVSMVVNATGFPDGRTGIAEVDAWLRTVNPHALTEASRVWSPDLSKERVATWSALTP